MNFAVLATSFERSASKRKALRNISTPLLPNCRDDDRPAFYLHHASVAAQLEAAVSPLARLFQGDSQWPLLHLKEPLDMQESTRGAAILPTSIIAGISAGTMQLALTTGYSTSSAYLRSASPGILQSSESLARIWNFVKEVHQGRLKNVSMKTLPWREGCRDLALFSAPMAISFGAYQALKYVTGPLFDIDTSVLSPAHSMTSAIVASRIARLDGPKTVASVIQLGTFEFLKYYMKKKHDDENPGKGKVTLTDRQTIYAASIGGLFGGATYCLTHSYVGGHADAIALRWQSLFQPNRIKPYNLISAHNWIKVLPGFLAFSLTFHSVKHWKRRRYLNS